MSPAKRREHLIEVALALFASRPPDQVTMEDIAEKADVSRALMYRYFPNTEAIQVAALGSATDELISRLTLGHQGTLLEQLRTALLQFTDFAAAYAPAYIALLRSGSVISTSRTDSLIDRVRDHAVDEILGRSGFDTAAPPLVELTVRCYVAVVEGATLSWLQDRVSTQEELVDWLTRQLMAMMSATTGSTARQ